MGDDARDLVFSVAVDDQAYVESYGESEAEDLGAGEPADRGRRAYITAMVKKRLHQRSFRERVLDAYREQCALCRLRHAELLDAAHIIPDGQPGGESVVSNGIALCKLHHAAFDKLFLGVRPDYVIEIHRDVLDEEDGPVLTHGLQGLHGKRIIVPRSLKTRPSPERLEVHYRKFLSAGRGLLR